MKPTHFRAYGKAETISRRDTNEGKMNLAHDVHDVVAEGRLKDGVAEFSSKGDVDFVAFYVGAAGDDQVCVGRIDGPFKAGAIKADSADIPDESAVNENAGEIVVDGQTYRKL